MATPEHNKYANIEQIEQFLLQEDSKQSVSSDDSSGNG
jgi:hypothetical protein